MLGGDLAINYRGSVCWVKADASELQESINPQTESE